MGSFTPHRGTHRFISNDTPISWASSLLRGTQRFISVSERTTHPAHGHLPFSGAHSVSSSSQRERHTQLMGIFPTQGHTTFHLRLREELHTHLMGTPNSWASSPHTGAHNVPSSSQRGTTHPSHGHTQLMGSLTWLTHSVCVLEDVSRSCNHQHK
jgi:hypothetical protein